MSRLIGSAAARAAAKKRGLIVEPPETPAAPQPDEEQPELLSTAPGATKSVIEKIRAEGEAARAADRAEFERRLAWFDRALAMLEGRQ